jgi:ornithine cyclodeaminase
LGGGTVIAMSSYLVLTDEEVRGLVDYGTAVEKMEDALRELADGTLVAPPRFSLDTELGSLVFTAGAATGSVRALGFRVYDTFAGAATDTDQIVAVFDPARGGLTGVIIGGLIGGLRTGALGGVAVKHLARPDAEVLAIVGAGFQARSQLQAALAVSEIGRVVISSRTPASADRLKNQVLEHHQVECSIADTAKDAVRDADVIICATSSTTPVIESDWVKAGAHVTTVGPKLRGAQELPSDFGKRCAIVVTDSMAQLESYGQFFLDEGPAPFGLDQIVAGSRLGRTDPSQITLYCSVGLAGTEVVLASDVLRRAAAQQGAAAGGQQRVPIEVW